jgi:hypothetical protein
LAKRVGNAAQVHPDRQQKRRRAMPDAMGMHALLFEAREMLSRLLRMPANRLHDDAEGP